MKLKLTILYFILTVYFTNVSSRKIYLCESNNQILALKICDGHKDCSDNSDEKYCRQDNLEYRGYWHNTRRTVKRNNGGTIVYNVRKILGPSRCLCINKLGDNPKDCLIMNEISGIINNSVSNCRGGQDEITDIAKLSTRLKKEELFKIIKYAGSSGRICRNGQCILKEFPSEYTEEYCPKNYYSYCSFTSKCVRNDFPCQSKDYKICPPNRYLNEHERCIPIKNSHSNYDEETSNECPPHRWRCPYFDETGRHYKCEVGRCNIPFSCKDLNKDTSSNFVLISLETTRKPKENFVHVHLNKNLQFSVSKKKTDELEFQFLHYSGFRLRRTIAQRIVHDSKINVLLRCEENSEVHLNIDQDHTVSIASMFFRSQDISQLIEVGNSEDLGGIVEIISPFGRINETIPPLNFFDSFDFFEVQSYLKYIETEKIYGLHLQDEIGISQSDVCPNGVISIMIQTHHPYNIVKVGQRTEAFVMDGTYIHYLDSNGHKQTYSHIQCPTNITIIIYILDVHLSQMFIKIDSVILELSTFETYDILDRIVFKQKPLSIKVAYSPDRPLDVVFFSVLLILICLVTILALSLGIFIHSRRQKEISYQQPRPNSIHIINNNEYYGETITNGVELECRYSNYYYGQS